jgi:hypothetical protein
MTVEVTTSPRRDRGRKEVGAMDFAPTWQATNQRWRALIMAKRQSKNNQSLSPFNAALESECLHPLTLARSNLLDALNAFKASTELEGAHPWLSMRYPLRELTRTGEEFDAILAALNKRKGFGLYGQDSTVLRQANEYLVAEWATRKSHVCSKVLALAQAVGLAYLAEVLNGIQADQIDGMVERNRDRWAEYGGEPAERRSSKPLKGR